ncbi:endonuclease/exonuclease/phosphatase family protein [Vibrio sp. SCSIO 43153]|uniref:endonuclease/exonuclease/phosphatase family protein n=1 Tax=Vibrio sp. SCSIO 43153 TaxID=2819098 RepID=UPI0020761BB3|nr:endonuclease/exonuclease/phosphatase family protein [Vibrio sp. SCSIO 43153]USD52460.1 endonuclease/exonuclease/phosphatase family protein [Vibrio sp. SCSIO 43153]
MSNKNHITFASANLFNFIAPPGAYYDFENIYSLDDWHDKLAWTKSQFEQLDPDVIGLQEVFSIEETKAFFAEIGYEYFATVDTPHIEGDYIYSRPVVAVASRFPIESFEAVTFDKETLNSFGEIDAPTFSRKPVRACIVHPIIGHISVYVTHLKSQRPADSDTPEQASRPIARWLSTQQRGWEAAMLRDAMQRQYALIPMPTVLMGDMNQAITPTGVNDVLTEHYGDSVTDLQLNDGWELQMSPLLESRPATHYHFAKGNVLDYILLSQEFDAHADVSIAEVTDYQVLDSHLINPSFERDKNASDHAFVALTVEIKL